MADSSLLLWIKTAAALARVLETNSFARVARHLCPQTGEGECTITQVIFVHEQILTTACTASLGIS